MAGVTSDSFVKFQGSSATSGQLSLQHFYRHGQSKTGHLTDFVFVRALFENIGQHP